MYCIKQITATAEDAIAKQRQPERMGDDAPSAGSPVSTADSVLRGVSYGFAIAIRLHRQNVYDQPAATEDQPFQNARFRRSVASFGSP